MLKKDYIFFFFFLAITAFLLFTGCGSFWRAGVGIRSTQSAPLGIIQLSLLLPYLIIQILLNNRLVSFIKSLFLKETKPKTFEVVIYITYFLLLVRYLPEAISFIFITLSIPFIIGAIIFASIKVILMKKERKLITFLLLTFFHFLSLMFILGSLLSGFATPGSCL